MNGFSPDSEGSGESVAFTLMIKRERHQYRLVSQSWEAGRLAHRLPLFSTAEEVVTELAMIQNGPVFKYSLIDVSRRASSTLPPGHLSQTPAELSLSSGYPPHTHQVGKDLLRENQVSLCFR